MKYSCNPTNYNVKKQVCIKICVNSWTQGRNWLAIHYSLLELYLMFSKCVCKCSNIYAEKIGPSLNKCRGRLQNNLYVTSILGL